MKKYVALFTATAGILGAIFWYGSTHRKPQTVEAAVIRAQTVSSTVLCSGKVEDAKSYQVDSQVPVVAGSVFVEEGDFVRKGDILMTVDREATVQALINKYWGSGNETLLVQAMAGITDASEWMDYLNDPDWAVSAGLTLPETITAPASGVIRRVQVEAQGLSGGGSPLFVVAANQQLHVRLSVSENVISDIQPGQSAVITGTGFKNSVYTGSVIKIADSAIQRLNGVSYETVVEVLLSVDQPGEDLKPGLSASATITTGCRENVLTVPYRAIRTDDDGREFVFRCINGKAVKTFVALNEESENGYTVSDGLSDGDVIILTPELAEDGMEVQPVITESGEEVKPDVP